jgi:dethiobiotin synthetase
MNQNSKNSSLLPADTKWAFTTRRVDRSDVAGMSLDFAEAVSGDIVLAQIMEIGSHKKIQLAEGRPSISYIHDKVVLTCGDRYAPDQFEGLVSLDPNGVDLLAGGGILGLMRKAHSRMDKPTQVKPLGLLTGKNGEIINIASYGLPVTMESKGIQVIAVVGGSMNAGKTTAAVSLAHGLAKTGLRVAGIKATGTGSFGDYNAFLDAGIPIVADFTDVGMASTYMQPIDRIEEGFKSLVAYAADNGADIAIVELADGIYQQETAELLRSQVLRKELTGVLFAAPDALGAVSGIHHLQQIGLKLLAVTGKVTRSILATEEVERNTHIPVISRENLCDPTVVNSLIPRNPALLAAA